LDEVNGALGFGGEGVELGGLSYEENNDDLRPPHRPVAGAAP